MLAWPPLKIGHRGAAGEAPENTLASFELAWRQGADGIEFDVQLSSDGVPMVIHDARLPAPLPGADGCGNIGRACCAASMRGRGSIAVIACARANVTPGHAFLCWRKFYNGSKRDSVWPLSKSRTTGRA